MALEAQWISFGDTWPYKTPPARAGKSDERMGVLRSALDNERVYASLPLTMLVSID